MGHAWCQDTARDEAVRAAEDGRDRPLPTLDEAIAMIPKSASSTSAPEHENKGNGMRTERITLEVTVDMRRIFFPGQWHNALRQSGALMPGESVRVVSDEEREAPPTTKPATTENDYVPPAPVSRPAETRQTQAERVGGGWWFPKYDQPCVAPAPPPAPPRMHRGSGVFDANGDEVPWEGVVATLTAERDAAIRERDEVIAESERRLRLCETMKRDRDSARFRAVVAHARVAELEAASGGGEPVAWMCEWADHVGLHQSKTDAEAEAEGDVFPQPLYRSPPQPRGWLTANEREAVLWSADAAYDKQHPDEDILRSLLTRSTPPEVMLPLVAGWAVTGHALVRRVEVRDALAAAGVAVKEVGRE
jgi:hypothetical protein